MAAPPLAARRPEVVLALLLSVCLVVLSLQIRRPDGQTVGEGWLLMVLSPFVDTVASTRGAASNVSEWLSSRGVLLRENRVLKADVARLEKELLTLRDADSDRKHLLLLLEESPVPPPAARPARLVAVEGAGPFRTALLDQGASVGIELGGAVVAPEGLLGRIVALGPGTARVQLLSDRTAAAGVLLVRTSRPAVARGDGHRGVSVLYVPAIEPAETGDPVVTSGTDGVYPSDLPVGRIAAMQRKNDSFWDIEVALAADPARTSLVLVLPPVKKPDLTLSVVPGKPPRP